MNKAVRISETKPRVKGDNKASLTKTAVISQAIISPADRILFLHRTIGNQAVARLIKSGTLQAKLWIGQLRDKCEQEADRVAEQVMNARAFTVGSDIMFGTTK